MDFNFFSKYMLPIVIGLIMFNLGLSLKFKEFKATFKQPKSVIIGLVSQMVLLPLIAFLLARSSDLPALLKVGIVLIAACPGGATSNFITYLLKGDVALSISLTSINSVLILFSIPGITFLAIKYFMGDQTLITLPFVHTVLRILFMIILPTYLGMLSRIWQPRKARTIENIMKYVTTGLLAVVFLFTFLSNNTNGEHPMESYISTAPYVLALNIIGMLAGYIVGYIAGFSRAQLITLSVEVGIQNSALAITIASAQMFLNSPKMAIPALIYGLFTFFNALLFGLVIKKWIPIRNVE